MDTGSAHTHGKVRLIVWPLMVAVAAALLVGVSVKPAAAADVPAAPSPQLGVQFHGMWASYTDATRAQVLDTLKANGATTVRIDISWRMLEPDAPGVFNAWGIGQADKVIHAAASRGLRPLVMLWMTPQWATGSADERMPATSPAALAALTDVSARLAARYHGVVDAWEVWNEPNDNNFMRGADPAVYANMLRAARAGFKQTSPSTPVVFGGVSYVDDEWVRAALLAGAAGSYDVMGVHPYQAVADEAPEAPDNGTMWRMNHLPALLAVMASVGDGAKPVWFTEFGWRAHVTLATDANWQRGVSPQTQADYLARTFAMVSANYPQVARMYWYKDRADSADPAEAGYGLVYPDGTASPALQRMGTLTPPPAPTVPGAVGSVKVAVKSGSALATWTAPTTGVPTGYRVELRQVGTSTVTVVNVPATARSATFKTRRGATYQVSVAAYNSAGAGTATLSAPFKAR